MYIHWFTLGNRRTRFAGNLLIGMGAGLALLLLQSAVLYGWQSFEMGELEISTLVEDCGGATYDGAGNGEVSKGCWYATRDQMKKNVYGESCPAVMKGDCPSFRLYHGDGNWNKAVVDGKSKIFSDQVNTCGAMQHVAPASVGATTATHSVL